MYRPIWIEVDLGALRSNYRAIRSLVADGVRVIATVKQNAYGHGLVPVTRELAGMGVDYFGVASIEEAIVLRESGIRASIIILTAVLSEFASLFIKYKITPVVVDLKFARALNIAAGKKRIIFPVHVKIDTGMGRLGPDYRKARKFIKQLAQFKNICLEGIYTHFPVADTDPEFTDYQIGLFNALIEQLSQEGINFRYHHCANSIGIVKYPNSHFNMVRPGLILYGIKPSKNISLKVRPVLSLKSKVVFVKGVKKGAGVSYGRDYVARKLTRIATIAAGYADGYPWRLSTHSNPRDLPKVIIGNKYFKLAGRVCMDHIMADIGQNRTIRSGSEVVLIGKKADCRITAQDMARWAHTITYEIVSCLSLKIPRKYKNAGK